MKIKFYKINYWIKKLHWCNVCHGERCVHSGQNLYMLYSASLWNKWGESNNASWTRIIKGAVFVLFFLLIVFISWPFFSYLTKKFKHNELSRKWVICSDTYFIQLFSNSVLVGEYMLNNILLWILWSALFILISLLFLFYSLQLFFSLTN